MLVSSMIPGIQALNLADFGRAAIPLSISFSAIGRFFTGLAGQIRSLGQRANTISQPSAMISSPTTGSSRSTLSFSLSSSDDDAFSIVSPSSEETPRALRKAHLGESGESLVVDTAARVDEASFLDNKERIRGIVRGNGGVGYVRPLAPAGSFFRAGQQAFPVRDIDAEIAELERRLEAMGPASEESGELFSTITPTTGDLGELSDVDSSSEHILPSSEDLIEILEISESIHVKNQPDALAPYANKMVLFNGGLFVITAEGRLKQFA